MKKFLVGDEGWLSNPTKFKVLNGWLTILWIIILPITIVTGLINLVVFISVISIYANFAAHLSTWAASRTEEAQDKDDSVQRRDVTRLKAQVDDIHKAVCELKNK